MATRRLNRWIWLFLLPLLFDQAFKLWAEGHDGARIPGLIAVSPVKNYGFSLGLFPDSSLSALVISVAVFILLLFMHRRFREPPLLRAALTLMLSGALSNILDRLFLGYVRDMLQLLFIHFYVFNPADVWVTGGACLAVIALLTEKKEASPHGG